MRCCKSESDCLVFDAVSRLPAAWDDFLPEQHELRTHHLQLYEQILPKEVACVYALHYQAEELVAVAYFQVLHVQQKHINARMFKGWKGVGVSTFLKTLQPRLLVAGHLFRHDISTFYTKLSGPFDAYKAYKAMIEQALRKCTVMAVMVKDMPQELVAYFQNFAPQYQLLPHDISMQMPIPKEWHTFQDYEQALKHKYAQKLRKVLQARGDLEFKALSAAEVHGQRKVIHQLYLQVVQNQSVRLGIFDENFLPQLLERYSDLRLWGIYANGRMLAFCSAWVYGDTFDMFYIGFDYASNPEYQLYFNILYYSIEQAIAHRKSNLVFGRTALEAKARLGCKPQYLYTFLYFKNGSLRSLVNRNIQARFREEGDWEQRHPFKQTQIANVVAGMVNVPAFK